MKTLIIILIVLLMGIGYGVYAFGLIGTPMAKDLGVRFSEADFISMEKKSGVKHDVLADGGKGIISYAGSHEVNNTFTSEDFSAFAQYASWKYLPFTNVQIRLNEDGTAELSGNMNTRSLSDYLMGTGGMKRDEADKIKSYVPFEGNPTFYIKVGGGITENKLENFSVRAAQIGSVPIPSALINEYMNRVETYLEDRIAKFPGTYVKSMTIEGGKLRYEGTLPDKEYTLK